MRCLITDYRKCQNNFTANCTFESHSVKNAPLSNSSLILKPTQLNSILIASQNFWKAIKIIYLFLVMGEETRNLYFGTAPGKKTKEFGIKEWWNRSDVSKWVFSKEQKHIEDKLGTGGSCFRDMCFWALGVGGYFCY